MPILVYSAADSTILYINQGALSLFELPETVVGQALSRFLPELEGQSFLQKVQEALQTGESATLETETVELSSTGEPRSLCISATYQPLQNESGEVWGVMQTLTHVSVAPQLPADPILNTEGDHYKFVSLVENSDDLIGITDLCGNVTYLNEAGQRLLGIESPEDYRRESKDFLEPVSYAAIQPQIAEAFAAHGRWRGEIVHKNLKTGELIPCEMNAFTLFHSITGEPIGMATVTRDLRKEKADKFQQSKLLALVENSADLLSILESNGFNSYVNKAGREMLGFESEEQVLTTPISELHRPEDFELVEREVLPSLMNQGRWEGQMMVRNLKTKEIFPVFNKTIRIDDPLTGEMLAVGALMRDLRPELAAQQAVADSERFLREIINAAPAGLWMTDEDMHAVYVNQVWLDWTGKTLEESIGGCISSVAIDADRKLIEEQFRADFQARRYHQSQFRIIDAEGKMRWIIRTGNPHYGSKNEFKGYAGACVDISDLIRSRQQVEENMRSLKTLVMTAPYALMILRGDDWRIELANQPIASLWDKELDQILGKTLLEVLPELEGQPFPALLRQVYNSGVPYGEEEQVFYLDTPEGPVSRYVSYQYEPLPDEDGNVCGVIVSANDITSLVESRKQLEEANQQQQGLNEELTSINEELAAANEELYATNEELAETEHRLNELVYQLAKSENHLKYLLNDAPVAIAVVTGSELLIESANRMMLSLWDKSEDIIGLHVPEAVPELQGQPFIPLLQEVFRSGEAYHGNEVEVLVLHNGRLESAYFNVVFHPVKSPAGDVSSIMVVASEVTDAVKVRRIVEQSEKQFRFLLDTLPQQVWTATPTGQMDYVNQVVCDSMGYSFEEVVAQGWKTFIHSEDLQRFLRQKEAALSSGTEFNGEYRLRTKKGEHIWHLFKVVPLKENGKIKLWLGTGTNIQLQKDNEQRKDEFLSIASHELKTPLTSIKAFIQLIQRSKDMDRIQGFAVKSSEHIFRLEKIVRDLLDVTKINAGKLHYSMSPFNFSQMLANSVESIQQLAPSHQIILEAPEELIVTGDQLRLEQVMQNLLNNAVKYSPDANKVIVTCKPEGEKVLVTVQDFGIGVSPEHAERLFDRYYRVDNTAMRFEGLGLGLFISSEILRRHQAAVGVESEQGKGSSFYFILPLNQENAAEVLAMEQKVR